MTMAEVLIGTAGWSYDDWADIVYPPHAPRGFDRLVYLAGLFDTVEVNSSFYRIPSRRTTESWARRTAGLEKFTFSVKLYRGLTHQRDPDEFDTCVSQFHHALGPLTENARLAAVLIQFPWSFRYGEDNQIYLERLVHALEPLPLVVEVRHRSWLNDAFLDRLGDFNASFCNIDQPALGQCMPATRIATSDLAYVRLHGRNADQWFAKDSNVNQRYNYLYNVNELNEWSGRIRELADKTRRVLVYTNNHFCGQAVANALQLKAIMEKRTLAVPVHLVQAFPQLREYAELASDHLRPDQREAHRLPDPDRSRRDRTGWLFDCRED